MLEPPPKIDPYEQAKIARYSVPASEANSFGTLWSRLVKIEKYSRLTSSLKKLGLETSPMSYVTRETILPKTVG